MGWKSFEPWLSRLETMEADTLWAIAEIVPPQWYGGDTLVIERLTEQLLLRRGRLRELIGSFRDSDRQPFPMWEKKPSVSVAAQFALEGVGKFVM